LFPVPQNKDFKRLVRARMAETGENYTQALTALLGETGELHGAMVDQIVAELGGELPPSVVAALRAVPRHLFTPGVPVTRAYEDIHTSIVTKRSERGTSLSSVSAPWIVAGMLTQLDVRPGQSVLEIGSGGYQAALLRELVGPDGSVTTMDIDPEAIGRARTCLDLVGYGDVRTVCADGEYGAPGQGPFDRIIIAVQAWDIPPAWTGQLAPGGRLVTPLLTQGVSRSWALDREDGHLVSRGNGPAGFVPMQGAGRNPRRWSAPVDEAGVFLWGDEAADVDCAALAGVLATERPEAWSGVTFQQGELITGPELWLATDPALCWLKATKDAVDRGLVTGTWKMNIAALASGGSLAYRARLRPVDDEGTAYEYGAYGHGPRAAELAERLAGHIRTWDRDHRAGPGPVLTVHPAGTPDGDLPSGHVLRKRHTTMVLSWPEAAPVDAGQPQWATSRT
jgi:protein-L-isoaspartate(D-aspartate) O-methyltransferase